MMNARRLPLFLLGLAVLPGCPRRESVTPAASAAHRPVRAAVIGGMTSTGLWQQLALRFTARTGIPVVIAATGDRHVCAEALRRGEADLLTMHSGDITTNLVADGYGANMRPWTRNDLVIVGPQEDPAGIRGLRDGAAALRRIAETRTPFLDFQGIGSREMTHNLWRAAGIPNPVGPWLLPDTTTDKWSALRLALEKGACLVVGRIPVIDGKMPAEGMAILVQGDPVMRRPYIVMEANPRRLPAANTDGARLLADFLLSDETQAFLAGFGVTSPGEPPLFHPVAGDDP